MSYLEFTYFEDGWSLFFGAIFWAEQQSAYEPIWRRHAKDSAVDWKPNFDLVLHWFSDFSRSLLFLLYFLLLCFLAFLFHTSRTGRRHDTSRSHHMFCIYGCFTVLILLSLLIWELQQSRYIFRELVSFTIFTFFIFWFGLLAGTGLHLDKRKDKGGVFCSIYSQQAWQGRT